MSLLPTTYTAQEINELRAALLAWFDQNQMTQDPVLVEIAVMAHMMAGLKAGDI